MHTIKEKIVAVLLVTIIIMANFSVLGENILKIYASNINLESQKTITNNENVAFDAYFIKEGEKVHRISQNIKEEQAIYTDIELQGTGYLKEAKIELDANFKVQEDIENSQILKIENNKIELNQIDGNSEKTTIKLPIYFDANKKVNLADFSKQTQTKLTATYIDEQAKEHKIEKTINTQLSWVAEPEVELEQKIEKYTPYKIEENKGIVIEQKIKVSVKNEVLPIAETNIQIAVPEIQNTKAKVNIYKENDNTFAQKDWNYNEQKGTITIKQTNTPNEIGEINWKTQEEYTVTYRYEEIEMPKELNFQTAINSNTKIYETNIKTYTNTSNEENQLTQQIGNIIEIQNSIQESAISKGYLYTNLENEENLEIKYNTNYKIDIAYSGIADELEILTSRDKFITDKEEIDANSYFKTIKINKQNMKDILGQDGEIKILSEGKEIAKITTKEEQENIEINIAQQNASEITLITTKPEKEGLLEISATKAIEKTNTISKEQIQSIQKLQTVANIKAKKENVETINIEGITEQVETIEPTSKIKVELSKKQISTAIEQEEIELKTILKNRTDKDALYKNPTIDIILPKEITKVEMLGAEMLYSSELQIEKAECVKENNNNIIKIKLVGNQTKYSTEEITEEATIVVRANISVSDETPTKTEKIQVIYSNEKTTNYEKQTADGRGIEEINIHYIAPTGLVSINTLSNYAQGSKIRSIAGSQEQGILETRESAKVATSQIQLINNYNNKINEISILGRTLTTGTADIQTSEDLNNTFDATMLSAITSSQISNEIYEIYYSENGKATKDLNIAENGWTKEPQDLKKVKSYLIVLPNYEMNTGDTIEFNYQMEIPEGLNYNEKVNSVYTVYFSNVQKEQTIKDALRVAGATLTTGTAPELNAKLTSYIEENKVVRKDQYIKFKVEIQNTGSIEAQNVALNIQAPNGNIYYYFENGKVKFTNDPSEKQATLVGTYKTKHVELVQEDFTNEYQEIEEQTKNIKVGTLKPGETATVEYDLKIEELNIQRKDLPVENNAVVEPEIKIENIVEVIADKMTKSILSNKYSLIAKEGKMQVEVTSDKTADYILTKGNNITYTARIENIANGEDLKNLEVKINIPEGLKIVNSSTLNRVVEGKNKKIDITTNQNTVTFKMEEYTQSDAIDFIVEAQVEDAKGTITPIVTAKADKIEEHLGNVVTNKVEQISISFEQQKQDQEYFKEKEDITYTYKLKNNSNLFINNVVFKNNIPEGTTYKQSSIKVNNEEEKIGNIAEKELILETKLLPQEEITILVTVTANKMDEGIAQKQIENYATVETSLLDTIESNHITSVIEYVKAVHSANEEGEEIEPQQPNVGDVAKEGTYQISGTAWIDEDKNGERQENEKLLPSIKVMLLNKEDTKTIKAQTTTDQNGKYIFNNIEPGSYIVVFEYNNQEYMLTQYQKDGISKIVNSDVISMEMEIEGAQKVVATSDVITITDSSIRNIDIGMYKIGKSDLSLEKYINKVTLTYANTTKTYEHNNAKVAKVEIPSKNMSEATVVVEYKIVVTNEGDISNYVKKIVDYVPTNMKFNAELNKDWYQSTNGDLYNSSLANTQLKPGESKEVLLTLSKKLTQNSAEIINNKAEIYEVYNEEGIYDIDSTPGNKVTKEDDMSSADLVISIKTGEIVAFTTVISTLICTTIGIVGYIAYKKIGRVSYKLEEIKKPKRRG